MTMAREPLETAERHAFPIARQISIFLDNRLGQLLRLTQIFDNSDVRILALSVLDSADYAVVRLLCDAPDEAMTTLKHNGFAHNVAEVVVVRVPPGKRGLLSVWQCLLTAEVNIAYCYPLLPGAMGPALALSVDNPEIAVDMLLRHDFEVLGEADLRFEV